MIVKPAVGLTGYGCRKFRAKYVYVTVEKANAAAGKRRRATGDMSIRAYPCGDHFHMGHRP